jgi:hypothetical protein
VGRRDLEVLMTLRKRDEEELVRECNMFKGIALAKPENDPRRQSNVYTDNQHILKKSSPLSLVVLPLDSF